MLALCMGIGAIPALAQSQASTGQIAGIVTDTQGATIPKATITATNRNTGMARSSISNDEGYYAILLLPPGIYNVAAEASGFAASTMTDVEVSVGRTRDLNISMGVTGVTEVVSVTAGAVQVQTSRSEADSVLNQEAIENLPINGRRFQDFVTLTPTAQVEPSRQQISLAGQRGINSNINVDGTDYNNPFFGGIRGGERSNFAFTIPQESIKEFQVVASGYSAEFGRSTGGIVNAVTKSGSNAWHGSAFYNIRPQDWAKQPKIVKEAQDNRNATVGGPPLKFVAAPTQQQFGGSFGGPIKKDKAFFFAAYEQQRFRNKRQVFFDQLATFTPTAATQEAVDFYIGLQEGFVQTNDAKAFTGRFDYEINTNHRFNVRYGWSDAVALNSTSVGNQLFPTISNALSNNGTESDGSHSIVGQFTSFFSGTLVNEFRGQWVREERPRDANSIEPNVSNTVGTYGTVNFLGQNIEFDRRIQAADSMTWSKGSHTFKFGGEYNHVFVSQLFGFNQTGSYAVAGTNVGTVLDVLTVGGAPALVNRFDSTDATYLRQIGNLMASYATDEIAFFGQDSWRIKPNFTLNYGLRWEGQYNPSPEANNTAMISKVNGTTFPNVFPSGHRADPTRIADNTKQFAPRLGFAWDPKSDGKTVIRGYTGIYFARTPLLLFAAAVNNWRVPAGDLSVQLPFGVPASNPNNTLYEQVKLIGIDLNTFSLGNLPDITPANITAIANALGLVVDPFTGAQPLFNAADYKNPKAYQGGLGVERQLTESLSVGADFTYVHTVYLQRNRDINVPKPVLRSLAVDPAQRPFYGLRTGTLRPISTLGQVQVRESTAKALYRALTFRAKFQKKWGQFNAFYTLSKNLSDDDNERSAGGFSYEDFYNAKPEYSNSNIDRRHQFVASPVFYLPFGIDFASAIRVFSGTPIDAGSGITDANGDRGGPDRPYLGPGVPFQRNAFRNRAIYGFDVHGAKRIGVGEGKKVVLTLDIFNVLNLQNTQIAGTASTNYCIAPPPPAPNVVPANCGFLGPTNPNFLSLVDHLPTSSRFGKLLLNNNPGAPLQVQVAARFQF